MNIARLRLLLALLLELAASSLLLMSAFRAVPAQYSLLSYFILHALATPWLARAMWLQLPRRYRLPARHSLALLYALIFCIPLLGSAGVFWGLISALRTPKRRRIFPLDSLHLPDLPAQPPQVHTELPYSSGALRQILRFADNPLKRIKAVMATRQMPLARAVPVWQSALRDRVDDVRLLSYSMHDGAEKKLSDRIQALQQDLSEQTGARAERSHAQIAFLAFELVYAGLVHGAVRGHWLTEAQRHAAVAGKSIALSVLRARIAMEHQHLDEAEEELSQAQQQGADTAALACWRAELAFRRRDFDAVSHCMQQAQVGQCGSDAAAVRHYWVTIT